MNKPPASPENSGRDWLDDPKHVTLLWHVLIAGGAAFLAIGLLLDAQPHFAIERWFGFYGWFGFLSCVLLVLAAKQLRRWLRRDEDYYRDGN